MGKNISKESSVEIICRIAEMLNNEIRIHGTLPYNNKNIWDNCLRQMSNPVWRAVLETLDELSTQHPRLFKIEHYDAIESALRALNKFDSSYDRVLDMSNRHLQHKKIAWKCLMTIREVYCAAVELDLPHSDSSKVKTTFDDIFT